MNIDDTSLSAFLDAELPATEMEFIRTAVAGDESLASHLAELAMIDEMVKNTYKPIEQLPLPESIRRLVKAPGKPHTAQSAKVIPFPVWRRAAQQIKRHSAVAATVALAVGLGIGGIIGSGPSPIGAAQWQQIASVLEDGPSGIGRQLADGTRLTPQLSFVSHNGEFCRQFHLGSSTSTSDSPGEPASSSDMQGIACREQQGWQRIAMVALQQKFDPEVYQSASGGGELERLLDQLMLEEALDTDGEQRAIQSHWQRP